MSQPPDNERYAREPGLLIDLCREVIDRLCTANDDTDTATMEAQLREIARAIDQLEKRNIPVPDALRGEKTRLASALDMRSEARQSLNYLADEFDAIAGDLKTRLGRNDDQQVVAKPRAKRSRKPKTDKDILREHIILALRKLGGRGRVADILNEMQKQLEGKLLPGDLEVRTDGRTVVWRNNAQWERMRMVEDGMLRKDSPNGVWELSETPR